MVGRSTSNVFLWQQVYVVLSKVFFNNLGANVINKIVRAKKIPDNLSTLHAYIFMQRMVGQINSSLWKIISHALNTIILKDYISAVN